MRASGRCEKAKTIGPRREENPCFCLPLPLRLCGQIRRGKRYHIKIPIAYHTSLPAFWGTLCKLTRISPDPTVGPLHA